MTDAVMALRTMIKKSTDADLLCEMIGFAAERLMELGVRGLTGAGHGERLAQRNGYPERDWETRATTISGGSTACPQADPGIDAARYSVYRLS